MYAKIKGHLKHLNTELKFCMQIKKAILDVIKRRNTPFFDIHDAPVIGTNQLSSYCFYDH